MVVVAVRRGTHQQRALDELAAVGDQRISARSEAAGVADFQRAAERQVAGHHQLIAAVAQLEFQDRAIEHQRVIDTQGANPDAGLDHSPGGHSDRSADAAIAAQRAPCENRHRTRAGGAARCVAHAQFAGVHGRPTAVGVGGGNAQRPFALLEQFTRAGNRAAPGQFIILGGRHRDR